MSLKDSIKKINALNADVTFYGGEGEEVFVYMSNGSKKGFATFDDFISWVSKL